MKRVGNIKGFVRNINNHWGKQTNIQEEKRFDVKLSSQLVFHNTINFTGWIISRICEFNCEHFSSQIKWSHNFDDHYVKKEWAVLEFWMTHGFHDIPVKVTFRLKKPQNGAFFFAVNKASFRPVSWQQKTTQTNLDLSSLQWSLKYNVTLFWHFSDPWGCQKYEEDDNVCKSLP